MAYERCLRCGLETVGPATDGAVDDYCVCSAPMTSRKWTAVWSITGIHIGTWIDDRIARDVVADHPGSFALEVVPLTELTEALTLLQGREADLVQANETVARLAEERDAAALIEERDRLAVENVTLRKALEAIRAAIRAGDNDAS